MASAVGRFQACERWGQRATAAVILAVGVYETLRSTGALV